MNRDRIGRALLVWFRRLARPLGVLLAVGLITPFVLHPVLGSGADDALGYVGIITIVVALIIGPCLVLPMGLAMDTLGAVDGSVVTVQTLLGPRSVDLAGLRAVRTLYLYGRGTDSVFWWLRDGVGRLVVFRFSAGASDPVLTALRAAVIELATAQQLRPSLRVRKELRLDESGTTHVLSRSLVGFFHYVVLIACCCGIVAAYVGLYSLAGIATA